MNDRIMGPCPVHQIPSPSGAPIPSPAPLPFSSPLTLGLETTVIVEGQMAAVQGSSGLNTPPHTPALHASDPHFLPNTQEGRVVMGSATVNFGGKPAAYSGCQTMICMGAPGQLMGTATTVLVAS